MPEIDYVVANLTTGDYGNLRSFGSIGGPTVCCNWYEGSFSVMPETVRIPSEIFIGNCRILLKRDSEIWITNTIRRCSFSQSVHRSLVARSVAGEDAGGCNRPATYLVSGALTASCSFCYHYSDMDFF